VHAVYMSPNNGSSRAIKQSKKNGIIQVKCKINVGDRKSRHNASALGYIRLSVLLKS
jgi:hypothetical protein